MPSKIAATRDSLAALDRKQQGQAHANQRIAATTMPLEKALQIEFVNRRTSRP